MSGSTDGVEGGPRRPVLLTALLIGVLAVVPSLGPAPTATGAVEPSWGSAEPVPPHGGPHPLALTATFPDGTVTAVWLQATEGGGSRLDVVQRSTRPPGGAWGDPVPLPVTDVGGLDAIAPGADGGLEIAYSLSAAVERPHQVRTWNADGSASEVSLDDAGSSFDLAADAEGDVVATRLGRYSEARGFRRAVRYLDDDDGGWQVLPSLPADPRDRYLPGPGDTVWMAGYDQNRARLRVRRWSPRGATWSAEWTRAIGPRPLNKPLVQGLDLALGGAGRVVLAWQQRARGEVGAAVRVVRREGRSGWTNPLLLDRRAAAEHRPLSAPVVAAAGDHGVVAWSGPASIPGLREVSTAWLTDDGADRRSLAVTGHFSGFGDLSLDVDLRADGDLLLTYLQRRGHRRQVMAWVGSWLDHAPTLLVRDAGVMRADSASLVAGRATVVATTGDGGLVSFTQER